MRKPVNGERLKKMTRALFPIGKRVVFEKDNEFVFAQDMSWWEGVPDDVVFEITGYLDDSDDKRKIRAIKCKAPGYGGSPYGNGSIFVYRKQPH